MAEQREVQPATKAALNAIRVAVHAHWGVCEMGCSLTRVACQAGKQLLLAEEDLWSASKWETLPPHDPIYTDPTSMKAVAR